MTKRSSRKLSKHARQKKRIERGIEQNSSSVIAKRRAQPAESVPGRPKSRATDNQSKTPATTSPYGYVFSDLKRSGIIAAIAFIILIVLALVWVG